MVVARFAPTLPIVPTADLMEKSVKVPEKRGFTPNMSEEMTFQLRWPRIVDTCSTVPLSPVPATGTPVPWSSCLSLLTRFSIVSRSSKGGPCGTRVVAGRILKESYGAAKQQHTFTFQEMEEKAGSSSERVMELEKELETVELEKEDI